MLFSAISIALVRSGTEGKRAIAVLAELAEGCRDPLIKKKLSVYAQQILAKSDLHAAPKAKTRKGVVLAAAASLALSLAGYQYLPLHNASHLATSGVVSGPPAQPQSAPVPQTAAPRPFPAEGGRSQEQAASQPVREEKAAAARSLVREGEVTPVRVVNNQVLVPVVLKQGGVSVKLELLLDTGASRTGVHESAIARLPLDLRQARPINVEVADGRSVRSRLATIDLVAVGPFTHPGQEIVVISFTGAGALHDGLLGMDILGRHRYQLDMEKEVIRWY
nr:retropepsin-like aspartic protease [Geomonas sp. Red32]